MDDLDKIMHYAVNLEFNRPQNPGEAAVIAIAFASPDHCSKAYALFKEYFKNQKLLASIKVSDIVLHLTLKDDKGEIIMKTSLNYDKIYFKEFIKTWPPGHPIALVFGVKRQCDFYLINFEKRQSDFSAFVLSTYEIIN